MAPAHVQVLLTAQETVLFALQVSTGRALRVPRVPQSQVIVRRAPL